jgi:hypothetical protein
MMGDMHMGEPVSKHTIVALLGQMFPPAVSTRYKLSE